MNRCMSSIFAISLLASPCSVMAITQVDVELQLLIDISGSISSYEYDMQLQGYENAFRNEPIQNAIINGTQGQIAVQLIMWSGSNQQEVMVDWTLVDSAQASEDLADVIGEIARPFAGWTATGSAIEYAYPLFEDNGFEGFSKIMDISGDGTKNSGDDLATASDNAINNGVDTINGIVITDDQDVIDEYFTEVVNGDSPFLLSPADFDDFQLAIQNKIIAEINGTIPKDAIAVPEPETNWLFGFAVLMLLIRHHSHKE